MRDMTNINFCQRHKRRKRQFVVDVGGTHDRDVFKDMYVC